MAEEGRLIYETLLPTLRRYRGKYVAIIVKTKQWFIGDTITEAVKAARSVCPDCFLYVAKIGAPGGAISVRQIRIDAEGNLRLMITLKGICQSETYEAIVDTGFSGDVAIPEVVAVHLGLKKVGAGSAIVATNEVVPVMMYEVRVVIMDREYDATAIVISPMGEVLVGMDLLSYYEICFNPAEYKATIQRVKEGGEKISLIEELLSILERVK